MLQADMVSARAEDLGCDVCGWQLLQMSSVSGCCGSVAEVWEGLQEAVEQDGSGEAG